MKRPALALALSALALGAATAQEADPAAVRQQMMAHVGKAAGHLGAMAKGEAPFDARLADAAFRTMNAAALGFGGQFPEGSESGAETEAAPAIWSDRAGFDAALAGFRADTDAAIAAEAGDLEAMRAAFGTVAESCKSCHEGYRIRKE